MAIVMKCIIPALLVLILNFPSTADAIEKGLVYGETGFPTTLDPITTNELLTIRVSELVFSGLVRFNERAEVVPDLALSWRFAADQTSVTFKLRKNVQWHKSSRFSNPPPFTAEDVKFTTNLLKHPKTQIPNRIRFEFIDHVSVIDPHTITFHFKRPMRNIIGRLSFKIIPKFALGGKDYLVKSNPFTQSPIGTGPYQLKNVTAEGEVSLTRHPNYFGKKPAIPTILLKPYADRNIMSQALLFNAIDLITFVNPRNIPEIDGDRRFRLIPYNALSYSFFAFNFRNKLLKSKNIRRAIALAIHRQEMLDSFFHGKGKLISGPFAPGSWAYNLNVKPLSYSPTQAAELLRKEGYVKKNAEGILVKNNQPLSFTLKVPISSESESIKRVILAFQNYLHKVGINVIVRFEEWHVWKKEVFQKHAFDIIFATWSFDDSSDISSLFHSGEIGPWRNNIGAYRNRQVDNLIIESKVTLDFETKRTINKRLHRILADDSPYVFLWTLTNYAAVNNKLRNVEIHPYRFFTFIDQWYFSK